MDTRVKDPNPCRVIGLLDDGVASLNATALAHLRTADVVIGGARTLALFRHELKADAVTHDLSGQLKAVPGWVRAAREAHRSSVVLATGDPLCHGIAPYLAQHLCLDALDILPNLSTLQLACARIGLAWQDARIVSVHSQDAGEWARGSHPDHGLYALAQALRASMSVVPPDVNGTMMWMGLFGKFCAGCAQAWAGTRAAAIRASAARRPARILSVLKLVMLVSCRFVEIGWCDPCGTAPGKPARIFWTGVHPNNGWKFQNHWPNASGFDKPR